MLYLLLILNIRQSVFHYEQKNTKKVGFKGKYPLICLIVTFFDFCQFLPKSGKMKENDDGKYDGENKGSDAIHFCFLIYINTYTS